MINAPSDDCVQDENKTALHKIHKAIEDLTAQERNARKSTRTHVDKAKARFDCENQRGAIMSMRKCHKLQAEQAKILEAIGYLRTLEAELESHVLLASKICNDPVLGRRSSLACKGMSKFTSFESKVQRILSCDQIREPEDEAPSDEAILSELASMTQTR
uniref:Uncharacterized protein n=1 Tax=Entomoneis paludosa TaxID=265537 RepID=A0A7S2YNP9_9STRA|mmetsp:Transcript_40416/g.84093  ORF Transcript_40416/g.84093 Transcript_40416/m.84093 type:complete len:160 (+) Transcript_40416:466-945(+)